MNTQRRPTTDAPLNERLLPVELGLELGVGHASSLLLLQLLLYAPDLAQQILIRFVDFCKHSFVVSFDFDANQRKFFMCLPDKRYCLRKEIWTVQYGLFSRAFTLSQSIIDTRFSAANMISSFQVGPQTLAI